MKSYAFNIICVKHALLVTPAGCIHIIITCTYMDLGCFPCMLHAYYMKITCMQYAYISVLKIAFQECLSFKLVIDACTHVGQSGIGTYFMLRDSEQIPTCI